VPNLGHGGTIAPKVLSFRFTNAGLRLKNASKEAGGHLNIPAKHLKDNTVTQKGYFVAKAEINEIESVEKAHFLNANAKCQNRSLGDMTGLTGFGFHILEVEPGRDTTELHMHHREDECIFILSGQGLAQVGEETFEVSEGDFLGYRKGGLPHSLRNIGAETLRLIVVGERGDTEIVDYPAQGKRMFRTKGLDWNVVDTSDIRPRVPAKKP